MVITFKDAGTSNPQSPDDCGAMPGQDVFGRDGEKLGVIAAVVDPSEEEPGGRVFLVEPDQLTAGPGDGLYVPDPLLGGLLLRPDVLADACDDRDALYVTEAAIADVSAEGVTLTCTGDEIDVVGWMATPAGLEVALRA